MVVLKGTWSRDKYFLKVYKIKAYRVRQRGFRVRRGSEGCGVVQTESLWLAVRQARVRISARHPRGGPIPSGSHEDNKKVLDK
jgi:hypothetical protein